MGDFSITHNKTYADVEIVISAETPPHAIHHLIECIIKHLQESAINQHKVKSFGMIMKDRNGDIVVDVTEGTHEPQGLITPAGSLLH